MSLTDSLAEDGEFEVTAEMLIHDDVDDEQTLVEAEAQESVAEVEEEVADLQQVLYSGFYLGPRGGFVRRSCTPKFGLRFKQHL